MNQKRVGILIAYLNLVMSMVVNIFLTPLMIKAFGDVDYSVYKVMQSFAGPLGMFHLGIATVVTRSIVKYNNTEDYTKKDKQNTMALALLVSSLMSVIVLIAGIIMYNSIPSMYGATYTAENLVLAKKIFGVFLLSNIVHMLTDAFNGCLGGYEKFIISSSIHLMKTVFRVVLIYVFLICGMSVLFVAVVDLIIAVISFVFQLIYAVFCLHEIPRLYYIDKKQIIEIFSFGIAILLQALINQVNNNMDTMILGAFVQEKVVITMYSSALTIYSLYNSLVSVVTNFFLPKATKLVSQNASGKELTDFVIVPGRFQAMMAVACLFGFLLVGNDFISLWIGEKYSDAYWVTLFLMVPVTIPLVENAAISILDATLKRIYRSSVLVVMAVINFVVSILLVKMMGYWGAAIGTFASLIIGHGFLMNVYYAKTFNMEIGRMFFEIFKGILPAGAISYAVCFPLTFIKNGTIFYFLVKCIAFIVIYLGLLWIFGANKFEKNVISEMIRKFIPKKKKRG